METNENILFTKIYLKTTISPEWDIATGTWQIYKHHLPASTNRFDDAYHQSLVLLSDMNPWTDQESLAILDRIYQDIACQHHVVGLSRYDYLHHCIELYEQDSNSVFSNHKPYDLYSVKGFNS